MNPCAKIRLLTRYVLRPAQWDENAAAWSKTIPHDFPGDFAALLKRKVQEGSWAVRQVERAGFPVGFVVYDVETVHECPPELVIVAMAGRDGSDMSEEICPVLFSLARELECKTVRFHTMRAGLIAKAEKLGFRVSEIILRADAEQL